MEMMGFSLRCQVNVRQMVNFATSPIQLIQMQDENPRRGTCGVSFFSRRDAVLEEAECLTQLSKFIYLLLLLKMLLPMNL